MGHAKWYDHLVTIAFMQGTCMYLRNIWGHSMLSLYNLENIFQGLDLTCYKLSLVRCASLLVFFFFMGHLLVMKKLRSTSTGHTYPHLTLIQR